ncbi:MAG: FAD-binding protein [Flavobacteriales bacterium]|nr:FAD-binding protein [Flavobacteriales bacterium]MDW8433124.1 FAD-binding protein [Flavobacteriales bacterium]
MRKKEDFNSRFNLLEYILTYHRGLFTTVFLLPISTVVRLFRWTKDRLTLWLFSAPQLHAKRVEKVQQALHNWIAEGCPSRLTTSRSGWQAMSELVPVYKKTHRAIPMKNMRDILHLDTQRNTVTVEPYVNMGQISRYLIPRGYTLPVLPELDELTVGGLINGFGVESSSHRFGLFQYTVESLDIITADGTLHHCSALENPDLFYSIPWSHGTLGFLVAAELKVIPCQPYVRLEYWPIRGLMEIVQEFEKASRSEDFQFVEMLMYGPEEAVLMTGRMAGQPSEDGRVNAIGRFWKPWFYKHAKSYLDSNAAGVEYIPLRHYYHRHTRSLFWEMEEIIPFGNHPVFRALLGWAVPPPISLLKYFETDTTKRLREQHHVVQDMLMPVFHLEKSLRYFEENYQLYPLWVCPMSVYSYPDGRGFLRPFRRPDGTEDPLYVDIGAYGTPRKPGFHAMEALRALEQFVLAHKGYQAMYARTLLSRDDFRTMFHHSHYDRLRQELPYTRQAFDEVYDKLGGQSRLSPADFKKVRPTS